MSKQQSKIQPSTLDFLRRLKENNNREWFNACKEIFLEEQALVEQFAGSLLEELSRHDLIETPSGKKILHRIYRDTRFSKEKIPYKTHFGGSYRRATRQLRGGYYFQIEPGNTFLAGGFYAPNVEDMKRIREEISFDPEPLEKILRSKSFRDTFGTLQGEQVKTTPKGFDRNDRSIHLLRHKQFLLVRNFTDEQVTDPSFLKEASRTFKNMRPFFDYMSNILGSDGDGADV